MFRRAGFFFFSPNSLSTAILLYEIIFNHQNSHYLQMISGQIQVSQSRKDSNFPGA